MDIRNDEACIPAKNAAGKPCDEGCSVGLEGVAK
jgi:hypothetical protein